MNYLWESSVPSIVPPKICCFCSDTYKYLKKRFRVIAIVEQNHKKTQLFKRFSYHD